MHRARSGLRGVIALSVLTLVAACASTGTTTVGKTAGATSGGPAGASATATPDGAPGAANSGTAKALRFTATTVDDKPFDGRSLAGKDAVFWFWAPWCTECRREAPHVAAVQASSKGAVSFVGVAGLGETGAMQAFVEDYEVGAFPHVADLDGRVWKRFGIVQQPAYAFVDDSGRVKVVRGELGRERLAAEVAELTGS